MNNTHSPMKKRLSFLEEYQRLTMLDNSYPLPRVIANIEANTIDVNVDRIRPNEWDPIFGALRRDNTLHYLGLRSLWQHSPKDKKTGILKKRPCIRTKTVVLKLTRSLKDLLYGNTCLECLVLQNIPFREEHIALLAMGLLKVGSLRTLSMEQCPIKDSGLAVLAESIKKTQCIKTINFTKCGLTWQSAETICLMIKYQGTQRHGEAWQASLRYRNPDLDHMHGLRRITLCQNKLGDDGAKIIADALKDDIWLKALDLQQCNISTDGATCLKKMLKFNKTLMVLDLRKNPLVSYSCLRSIIEAVMIQAGGEDSEFSWISDKEMTTKSNASLCGKRLSFSTVKKCKVTKRRSLQDRKTKLEKDFQRNTTSRSIRDARTCRAHLEECDSDEMGKEIRTYNHGYVSRRDDKNHSSFAAHNEIPEEKSVSSYLRQIQHLQTELGLCKTQLMEEKEKKRKAEEEMERLKDSNNVLTHSIEYYKMQLKDMEKDSKKKIFDLKIPDLSQVDLLESEGALESIESSFKQFQLFLDMLKNLGLEDVCSNLSKPENDEKP